MIFETIYNHVHFLLKNGGMLLRYAYSTDVDTDANKNYV